MLKKHWLQCDSCKANEQPHEERSQEHRTTLELAGKNNPQILRTFTRQNWKQIHNLRPCRANEISCVCPLSFAIRQTQYCHCTREAHQGPGSDAGGGGQEPNTRIHRQCTKHWEYDWRRQWTAAAVWILSAWSQPGRWCRSTALAPGKGWEGGDVFSYKCCWEVYSHYIVHHKQDDITCEGFCFYFISNRFL